MSTDKITNHTPFYVAALGTLCRLGAITGGLFKNQDIMDVKFVKTVTIPLDEYNRMQETIASYKVTVSQSEDEKQIYKLAQQNADLQSELSTKKHELSVAYKHIEVLNDRIEGLSGLLYRRKWWQFWKPKRNSKKIPAYLREPVVPIPD